jgi:hypothetical protein
MYTSRNFKSKKELKDAVALYLTRADTMDGRKGEAVRIYAPGLGKPVENGIETVCGPHYPAPHKWYAQVVMKDGIVIKVR